MRIELMRRVDFWIGIPFCFLLSLINKIGFIKKRKAGSPKKILFLGISEMGSIILSYPAIRKVKEINPQASLYFCTFKRNQQILRILDIVPRNNLILINDKGFLKFILSVLKAILKLRREKIEATVDMELFSRFTAIFSFLSGAIIRVGFYRFAQEGLYRGNISTHKVQYNPYKHISLNFLNLVNSLKYSSDEFPLLREPQGEFKEDLPKIEVASKEKEQIWDKLKNTKDSIDKDKKLVVLNLGTGQLLPIRKWPLQSYLELINRLLQHPQISIVIIGLKGNRQEEEKLVKITGKLRCISLVGKTTIRELINLFEISRLFISHDSGLVHLAALTNINIIVLFGPETPICYAPLTSKKKILYSNFSCSPCFSAYNHRKSLCRDNKCLKAIRVEEVYNLAKEYLDI